MRGCVSKDQKANPCQQSIYQLGRHTHVKVDVGHHSRIGLFKGLPDLSQILVKKKVICNHRLEREQLLGKGSYSHIDCGAGGRCSGRCDFSDESPLMA